MHVDSKSTKQAEMVAVIYSHKVVVLSYCIYIFINFAHHVIYIYYCYFILVSKIPAKFSDIELFDVSNDAIHVPVLPIGSCC